MLSIEENGVDFFGVRLQSDLEQRVEKDIELLELRLSYLKTKFQQEHRSTTITTGKEI